MEFSGRLDLFGDEVFAALNARRRELEAEGRRVFDLSVGTPDFEPPAHVIEALRESAADPTNWKYSLHDKDELLDAVCAYYESRYGVSGITRDRDPGGPRPRVLRTRGPRRRCPRARPVLPGLPERHAARRRTAALLPPHGRA